MAPSSRMLMGSLDSCDGIVPLTISVPRTSPSLARHEDHPGYEFHCRTGQAAGQRYPGHGDKGAWACPVTEEACLMQSVH